MTNRVKARLYSGLGVGVSACSAAWELYAGRWWEVQAFCLVVLGATVALAAVTWAGTSQSPHAPTLAFDDNGWHLCWGDWRLYRKPGFWRPRRLRWNANMGATRITRWLFLGLSLERVRRTE